MNNIITIILGNGLCNRLIPLISVIRLAKKSNRKINLIFYAPPRRSCMLYYGDKCNFYDLFQRDNDLFTDTSRDITYNKFYMFPYQIDKDKNAKIDISENDNIHINYVTFSILSEEDDNNTMFMDLKKGFKNVR
jgi:hypothetical protein